MYAKLAIGAALAIFWTCNEPLDAAAIDSTTLMGMLAEWKYPGSDLGGAKMSDGGNRALQSVKCQAVLTTQDSVDEVARYYVEKFVSGPADPSIASGVAQSVSDQNDSSDRPLDLRIITINRANTSTTLVISRAKGEKMTHVAWSHYKRLG